MIPGFFHLRTFAEVLDDANREHARRVRFGWGHWHFDADSLQLVYVDDAGCEAYWLDLEQMKDSARALDWIVQLSHKAWHSAQDLADLVGALDDLFDLQGTVCSWGQNRKIRSPRKALAGAIRIARDPAAGCLEIREGGVA